MTAIDDKARRIPWIGAPVDAGAGSGEMDLGDGRGRARDYEHASIYWTPQTGAFEIHGDIRVHYGRVGGHRGFLHYPITDETGTPDGVGRFNHFEGGSIYWTPGTGAREVHGAIRDLWQSRGWERSWLGYPTSDEHDMSGGRVSLFQRGKIEWSPSGGARATRMVPIDDA
jgi:uncharacterized protein with LGFP repeats